MLYARRAASALEEARGEIARTLTMIAAAASERDAVARCADGPPMLRPSSASPRTHVPLRFLLLSPYSNNGASMMLVGFAHSLRSIFTAGCFCCKGVLIRRFFMNGIQPLFVASA